ncbi:hypothetical protein O6H91_01G005500 [Diphasiastrum complanatum]|nr:hypothetical protein O6H91_01G005500 [Diphasiastrum complanatum]
MFGIGIAMQILACTLYNNWWPMLTGLLYVMMPMPCLFFGGGSAEFFGTHNGGGGSDWVDAAKFLTGFSAIGSIAIPAILRHAMLIKLGAMLIAYASFLLLICTILLYMHITHEEEW